jgi:hypothetical protein
MMPTGAPTKGELEGIKWFRPRSAMQQGEVGVAVDDGPGGDNGDASSNSVVRGIEKPTYKVYCPQRQPLGPDGSIGFVRRFPTSAREKQSDANDEAAAKAEIDKASEASVSTADAPPVIPVVRSKPVLNPSVPAFVFPSL